MLSLRRPSHANRLLLDPEQTSHVRLVVFLHVLLGHGLVNVARASKDVDFFWRAGFVDQGCNYPHDRHEAMLRIAIAFHLGTQLTWTEECVQAEGNSGVDFQSEHDLGVAIDIEPARGEPVQGAVLLKFQDECKVVHLCHPRQTGIYAKPLELDVARILEINGEAQGWVHLHARE